MATAPPDEPTPAAPDERGATARRTAVLVVNPISGSGRGSRAVERFVDRAREHGVDVEVRPTERAGHAVDVAAEAALGGAAHVVAAGGDGTVNEVARGLLAARQDEGRRTSLAVLPRGTSNLVARHLGVPRSPERAADVLGTGRVVSIDVPEAGGRPFLACAGVGWDGRIVELLSERRTGNIGKRSYAVPIAKATVGWHHPSLRVETAAEGTLDACFVLAMNMRPYSAYFRPAPGASATDGLLDVVVMERGATSDLVRWTWRALRGTLPDDPRVRVVRTDRVVVRAEGEEAPLQIDGDVGGRTPVAMLVRAGALDVVCAPAVMEKI